MKRILSVIALCIFATQSLAMDNQNARPVKGNYGFEFRKLGSFEDAIHTHLQEQPNNKRRVIEFGGGYGRLAREVVSEIEHVAYTFTDISVEQVDELRGISETFTFAEGAKLTAFACDATQAVDIDDESADVVIVANVWHFLPPHLVINFIENARRILAPGGMLFIMTQTPHFIAHQALAILNRYDEKKAALRNQHEAVLQSMEKSGDLFQLLNLKNQSSAIVAQIKQVELDAKPYDKACYSNACFERFTKIYAENNVAYPGYTALRFLAGESRLYDGNRIMHNVMLRPYIFLLSQEALSELVTPFGFHIVDIKEYNIEANITIEKERGAYLGAVLQKTDNISDDQIQSLKEDAVNADAMRERFHATRKVIYNEAFPFLHIVDNHACESCLAPNAKSVCGRCKAVQYCSRECQLKDWKFRHSKHCGK